MIADGETISYSSSDVFTDWPRITKGAPYYGSDHSETAEAMYFFENNQGTGEKQNYHPDDASWDKDKKPYGTYIEVRGYYINRNDYDASHGEIIYRFMLGQDVTSDFNAEETTTTRLRSDSTAMPMNRIGTLCMTLLILN